MISWKIQTTWSKVEFCFLILDWNSLMKAITPAYRLIFILFFANYWCCHPCFPLFFSSENISVCTYKFWDDTLQFLWQNCRGRCCLNVKFKQQSKTRIILFTVSKIHTNSSKTTVRRAFLCILVKEWQMDKQICPTECSNLSM